MKFKHVRLVSDSNNVWIIRKSFSGAHNTFSLIGELEKENELKVEAGFAIIFLSSMRCIRPVSYDFLLGRSGLIFFRKTPSGCFEVFNEHI